MSYQIFQKIVNFLEESKISYQLLEHGPVFTSEQAAKVRGTNIKAGAKALVFKADGKPVMIVVPGDKRVDTKRFKEIYKVGDLTFVSAEEVEGIMEGVKIGAVHPLGNLHNLPVYIDQSLGRNKEIIFNAGLHEKSIKMSYQDYYKLVRPIIGSFTI